MLGLHIGRHPRRLLRGLGDLLWWRYLLKIQMLRPENASLLLLLAIGQGGEGRRIAVCHVCHFLALFCNLCYAPLAQNVHNKIPFRAHCTEKGIFVCLCICFAAGTVIAESGTPCGRSEETAGAARGWERADSYLINRSSRSRYSVQPRFFMQMASTNHSAVRTASYCI